MCGGTGEEKAADAEIQKHCDAVKADVEKHLNKKFDTFEAKKYTSQVVAGTNYFIKVHVGNNDCIHIRIYKTLPHAGSQLYMHGVQEGKNLEHPVEYFDQNAGNWHCKNSLQYTLNLISLECQIWACILLKFRELPNEYSTHMTYPSGSPIDLCSDHYILSTGKQGLKKEILMGSRLKALDISIRCVSDAGFIGIQRNSVSMWISQIYALSMHP